MSRPTWDQRVNRAAKLCSIYPFAAQGLSFYICTTEFQRGFQADIQKPLSAVSGSTRLPSLRDNLDLFLLLPRFSPFLQLIERSAPATLAQTASSLKRRGSPAWGQLLECFWDRKAALSGVTDAADGEFAAELLAWIFLQPYAEFLAGRQPHPNVPASQSTCPACGANPIVAVLRQEGDGAKKSLICMLCAHEWNFRRVYCPACGEEREPQMAFYTAPDFPHVRVDVCDTCHTYSKTIDLTKTGLAVPVVDELAAIPLDLWAREHGYDKLQTNMLGT